MAIGYKSDQKRIIDERVYRQQQEAQRNMCSQNVLGQAIGGGVCGGMEDTRAKQERELAAQVAKNKARRRQLLVLLK